LYLKASKRSGSVWHGSIVMRAPYANAGGALGDDEDGTTMLGHVITADVE
jgi:hypothetical protein